MTARVINDPAALGWEFDPATGRWTWGGSGSGSGGGGTPFPEAPVDNKQYGRQNASWTEIVGGGTPTEITSSMVKLENPTRLPSGLENQQDANAYIAESLDKLIDQDGNVIKGGIEEAPSDSVIYGRQNQDWVAVPTGGGGGDVDLSAYYTAAQCDSKFEPKFTKNTAFNKNFGTSSGTVAQGNHDHSGVYQPAGSYALTNHNHSGVYAPVSHTHNYAAVGASYTKAESDNRYEPKGAGSGFNGTYSGAQVQFTCSNTIYALKLDSPNAAIFMTGSGLSGKYMRITSNRWEILTGNYASVLMSVNDNGIVTATDLIATSDRNKKDHIETAPTGVIEKLRGVTFQWKDTGAESSGVIAQELQDAGLGHLVHEDDDGLKVSYNGLTAYLIEEVKLLRKELEALKGD